jgi:early secretory antigenic target protein ESAT-6
VAVGGLRVEFPALEAAADAAGHTVADLEDTLGRLRTAVTSLTSTWTGDAAEAYQAAQREWDLAAADLRQFVFDLHRVVSTAHGNYRAAVVTNTGIWQGR